ncbi:FecR family protein [Sphingobacterium sp. CZ-2]|uniref:FecR family protein n=1 Tax=Sphingobacterium sp. CZ-2 TaxID=2557994 RepID=UPI0010702848|nr:FecR family protein [Sphingobacterium sp. CZ-2]QBR13278.1 FecR family protein [Sphingobacterium sp. CZ-2]
MHKNRFEELNQKFLNNIISEEELQEYLHLLEEHEDLFYHSLDSVQPIDNHHEFDQQQVYKNLLNQVELQSSPKTKRLNYKWISIAATLLIASGIGFYLYSLKDKSLTHKDINVLANVESKEVSNPLHENAAILLADGTEVALEDLSEKGMEHDGVELSKTADDMIKVSFSKSLAQANKAFHEFRTAKGTSYNLQLPDGSKVFLNSGSVFKISAEFNEENRNSELSGEAFFEVAHNPEKPFLVKTKDYQVKVLGTQFNVKSYPTAKQSKTSLLKGSVQVNSSTAALMLKPGEQANGQAGNGIKKVRANFREVLAWRDGYFRFQNASVREIMNDIINWYDIKEVVYEFNSEEHFTGSIVRSRSLHDVLHGMEKISNLKFEIREGRVFVRK